VYEFPRVATVLCPVLVSLTALDSTVLVGKHPKTQKHKGSLKMRDLKGIIFNLKYANKELGNNSRLQ
jgi:hypothetical protein